MRLAAFAVTFFAVGDTPSRGGGTEPNHDTLYGIVFTGIVTLILGYLTYRNNARNHNRDNNNQSNSNPQVDPRDAEIADLKSQRDIRDTELNNLRKSTHKTIGEQAVAIARYRELLVQNGIDPDLVPPVHELPGESQ